MAYKKRLSLLVALISLTVIFILFQLSLVFNYSTLLQAFLKSARMPHISLTWQHLGPLILFVVIQLCLNGLLVVLVWGITRLNSAYWGWSSDKQFYIGVGLWLATVVAILLANQLLYPLSAVSQMLRPVIPHIVAQISVVILSAIVVVACLGALVAVLGLIRYYPWLITSCLSVLIILVIAGVGYFDYSRFSTHQPFVGSKQKPNIIFIGIDSLRPDYTSLGAGQPITGHSLMPRLDRFLQQGTVFTQAYTPIARTLPSWASVLTGLYPPHSGFRFDLLPSHNASSEHSLRQILQNQGYQTYFSTDEPSFSKVGKHFHFQHVIQAKTGYYNFLLTSLNDFPISNLTINSRLGEWLFPYSAINRSAATTYEPSAYNHYVEHHLRRVNPNKPLLLAIHFCLPHWPYIWRSSDPYHLKQRFPQQTYAAAVKRNDKQISRFIKFLRANHFLDHTIVIVLSDHGESLLKPHDRVIHYHNYRPGLHSSASIMSKLDTLMGMQGYHWQTSFSHGTDVLSPVQYHIVLGMRSFGLGQSFYQGSIDHLVSTIDIKSTILNLLGLSSSDTPSDGRSLVPYLRGHTHQQFERPFYMETGFDPRQMKRIYPDKPNSIASVLRFYRIEPNNQISIKPSKLSRLITFKQRAVRRGHWLLAFYPEPSSKATHVLVNLKTGLWTDDLTSALAKQAPVALLLRDMKRLYGSEISKFEPYNS